MGITLKTRFRPVLGLIFAAILVLPIALFPSLPAAAGTLCNDGWVSGSAGQGTCSWHGGIQYTYSNVYAFKNCKELNLFYPNGVARSRSDSQRNWHFQTPKISPKIYSANARFDRDKNGLICEVILKLGSLQRPLAFSQWDILGSFWLSAKSFEDDATTDVCSSLGDYYPKLCLKTLDENGNVGFLANPEATVRISRLTLKAQNPKDYASILGLAFKAELQPYGRVYIQDWKPKGPYGNYLTLAPGMWTQTTLASKTSQDLSVLFVVDKSAPAFDGRFAITYLNEKKYFTFSGVDF